MTKTPAEWERIALIESRADLACLHGSFAYARDLFRSIGLDVQANNCTRFIAELEAMDNDRDLDILSGNVPRHPR